MGKSGSYSERINYCNSMNKTLEVAVSKHYSAKTLSIARWISYFAILDLLILPYFQKIIMPYSLPVIVFAFFFLGIKLEFDRYLKIFLIFCFVGIISVMFSFVLPGDYPNYFVDNLKRLIQLITSFLYFFYFKWLIKRTQVNIFPILVFFICWFFSFAIYFYFNPLGFGELIRIIYGKVVISESDIEMHLRYAYFFSDPNTAAYFFLIATSPLLIRKMKLRWRILILTLLVVILFIAQSRGAIMSLLLVVLFMFFNPSTFLRNMLNVKKILFILIILIIISAVVTYIQLLSEDNLIVKYAIERIFESGDANTGIKRFFIWGTIIINFYPLPFGHGYNLLIKNVNYGPHSDALRLVYSYGFVSFGLVFYFLFGKVKNLIPLIIPALITFMINSLFDEEKVIGIFLIYLAIYTTRTTVSTTIKNVTILNAKN